MQEIPSRAAPFSISATREGCRSKARTVPRSPISSATVKLLEPGAAQRSKTVSPGCAPRAQAHSWDAVS